MWGRLLLSLFWCDCSAFFLGHLRFSAACHAAGYPSCVPHLADSGWLTYSCSGGLVWGWGCLGTDVLLPHLVFYLVRAQLPLPLLLLRGSAPLAGASACLTPVCWSTPEVGLEGSLLRHLVFSHVPCSSSGSAGSLGVFPVTRCLSCFPGDVGWASALPFFFCASPAPLACRGSWGFAPCVRVLQLWWCLLGLKVRSPCCPSLTLGWVCFWPAVSQTFVGCEGGLGCPSWFVTALGLWTAYSGRWMVQVPAVFLNLTLGSSLSLPVLAAGLRWLRFILGCPPSVASLWRGLTWFFIRYLLACPHGAAVPLYSWVRLCSYSSCWVTYLRSGRCSSSVHDCDVAFPPLVGFAFGLSAVPLPQVDAVGFGLCWSARLSGLLTGRC